MARLLRPQGRRGELLADLLTDLPGVLVAGRAVVLTAPHVVSSAPKIQQVRSAVAKQQQTPDLRIEEVWFPTGKNAGRIVLKLSGCDSISQAEALAGFELLVPVAELPPLDPDTFFVSDLIGCDLYDGGVRAGGIVDVQFAVSSDGKRLEEAAPLLAIQRTLQNALTAEASNANAGPEPVLAAAEPVLVPFVRAWLDSVDIAARRVVMHLPPGLLAEL